MKKHLFGLLALLLLLALTACSSGSSSGDDDADTIPNGYYVYSEGGEALTYIRVSGSSATMYEAVGGSWEEVESMSYTLSGNRIMVEGYAIGTYNSGAKTITTSEGTLVYSATLPRAGNEYPAR